MTIIRPPYADAPGAIRPTLAEDRWSPIYPPYQPEIRPSHVDPPWSWRQRLAYGRHSKANTRAAHRADPARWGELHDLILHLAAERVEARRTGQALTTRSAS